MAVGEVRTAMTVTVLQGGQGSAPGGMSGAGGSRFISTPPVARRADLLGPMGVMSDYSGQRQAHWGSVLAKEMAASRQSTLQVQEALMRHRALAEMEVASARRASDAAIAAESAARRNRLLSSVRGGRFTGGAGDDLVERKLNTKFRAAGKLGLRNMVRGSVAAAATSTILPEGGGLASALSRIAGDTVAGAAFGGKAGAAFALIWSTLGELKNYMVGMDKELQQKRQEDAEVRRHVNESIRKVQDEFREFERNAREEWEKFVKIEAGFALSTAYRESRHITYDLVP